jgi:hypothetical protein
VDIDYVLTDCSRPTIEDELANMGLHAGEKFWRMMEEPAARAYQYKVVARPGAPGAGGVPRVARKPNVLSPYDAKLVDELAETKRALADRERRIAEYKRTLRRIHGSRTWKVASALQRLRSGLRTRLRGRR